MKRNGRLPVFCLLSSPNPGVECFVMGCSRKKKYFKREIDAGFHKIRLRAGEIAVHVKELAVPLCESEGVELVHVEYQRESNGKVLRVYIDKTGGVKLDDCADISRQLNDILDVSLDYQGAYRLEVTSPGPNRPLGDKTAFERFKGHKARIQIARSVKGQKTFTGILQGISDHMVTISKEDATISIPLKNITRARLVDYHGEDKC